MKKHQMQEDSLSIFTLHVDHLRRTGRRTDRRPYGILSIDTLYRLRLRITTFRISGIILGATYDCRCHKREYAAQIVLYSKTTLPAFLLDLFFFGGVFPFRLLLLDELAGGWIEDHTESCPSTPSTDFVLESQPSGLASIIFWVKVSSMALVSGKST